MAADLSLLISVDAKKHKYDKTVKDSLLCILTSQRVLSMPFAGQLFDAKITFCVRFSHKMYKITQKITKNLGFKGGLPT